MQSLDVAECPANMKSLKKKITRAEDVAKKDGVREKA
jgi:hypothetical protein